MKCNVENMLHNAGKFCGKSGYQHDLKQLGEHLKELRDRWRAGDKTVVDEFFELYVFSEKNE